jgi:hypothetical protein
MNSSFKSGFLCAVVALALSVLLTGMGGQQGELLLVGQGATAPSGGAHAMTVVNYNTPCGSTSGSNFSCPITATTSGDSILLPCTIASGNFSSSSPASAPLITPQYGNALQIISGITPGTTSISVTVAGGPNWSACQPIEVAGLVISSPLDAQSGWQYDGSNTGTATGNSDVAIATTNPNDACIGYAAVNPAGITFTDGTGTPGAFTSIATFTYSTNALSQFLEFANLSASGTCKAGFTFSGSSTYYWNATVALKLQ